MYVKLFKVCNGMEYMCLLEPEVMHRLILYLKAAGFAASFVIVFPFSNGMWDGLVATYYDQSLPIWSPNKIFQNIHGEKKTVPYEIRCLP